MEWYYVWWHWLTYKRVAQVCQHQLIFLSIILSNRHIFRRFLQKNLRQYLQRLLVRNFFYTPDVLPTNSVKIQSYCMHAYNVFFHASTEAVLSWDLEPIISRTCSLLSSVLGRSLPDWFALRCRSSLIKPLTGVPYGRWFSIILFSMFSNVGHVAKAQFSQYLKVHSFCRLIVALVSPSLTICFEQSIRQQSRNTK